MKGICLLCKVPSEIKPIELLPEHGTVIQALHPDGTTHKWTRFNSIAEIGRHRIAPDPKIVVCPKCGDKGRVNNFRRYTGKSASTINYVIVHEPIGGTWGKSKIQKRNRCYINDPEQRKTLLRSLGRLIEEPRHRPQPQQPRSQPQQKHSKTKIVILCPRCNLPGNPKTDHVRSRYFVDHHSIHIKGTWGKNRDQKYKQCCMRRGSEVQRFLDMVTPRTIKTPTLEVKK